MVVYPNLGYFSGGGPCFFFKGLALPWFGSPLATYKFLLSVALGSLPLERKKERNKQRAKERYK